MLIAIFILLLIHVIILYFRHSLFILSIVIKIQVNHKLKIARSSYLSTKSPPRQWRPRCGPATTTTLGSPFTTPSSTEPRNHETARNYKINVAKPSPRVPVFQNDTQGVTSSKTAAHATLTHHACTLSTHHQQRHKLLEFIVSYLTHNICKQTFADLLQLTVYIFAFFPLYIHIYAKLMFYCLYLIITLLNLLLFNESADCY